MKLVLRLFLGIILGTLMGLYLPTSMVRALITVQSLFGNFIGFVIPFIILLYITHGIAGLGHKSGRILGITVGLTYLSTIGAGLVAYGLGVEIIPLFAHKVVILSDRPELTPYFNLTIAPLMSVTTALVMAFIFGIGIGKSHANTLEKIAFEGKHIMDMLLSNIIVPLLPIYIACIFTNMAAQGTVFETIKTFVFVLGLAMCIHWLWLLTLYFIAGLVAHRNPFELIKNMLPAYFTAAGTMSSTATIPVTLRSVKANKISNMVADFGVPLCATIHISGSVITITTCSIAVMLLSPNLNLPAFPQMLQFIIVLGLIMIAAPGIPGGGVMASLGILASMLGFDETALGLMIALYIAQDSLGTAANVTGDGAILAMVDKWTTHQ